MNNRLNFTYKNLVIALILAIALFSAWLIECSLLVDGWQSTNIEIMNSVQD